MKDGQCLNFIYRKLIYRKIITADSKVFNLVEKKSKKKITVLLMSECYFTGLLLYLLLFKKDLTKDMPSKFKEELNLSFYSCA